VARDRQARPGCDPTVDDVDVPVDGEPVLQCVGDDPSDAIDGGELIARGGADGVE
jgi:hypothetical protein